MSWAEKCCERWWKSQSIRMSAPDVMMAAIREALEKAAQVADDPKWDAPEQVGATIRALMVDP